MKQLFLSILAVGIIMSGTGCSKEKPLAEGMVINSVSVSNFPGYQQNGQRWDDLSLWPDIYFTFDPGTNATGNFYANSYYEECPPLYSITWDGLGLIVDNLNQTYTFGIWDYDTDAVSDFIGSITFTVSADDRRDRPEYIEITYFNVSAQLYVTWVD